MRWCGRLFTKLEDLALWWLHRQGMDLASIGYRWGAYAVVCWEPEDAMERREGLTVDEARAFLWRNEGPIAEAMMAAGVEQMYHQLAVDEELVDEPEEPSALGVAEG